MPTIRVTGLTPAQSRAMKEVMKNAPGLVETVKSASVVLKGTVRECRDGIQDVMDAARDAGSGNALLNSLASIRNKLDDAFRADGETPFVSLVADNGVNVEGAVPPVLAGVRVDSPGENVTVPVPRSRTRVDERTDVKAPSGTLHPVERDDVLDKMRPTLPQPEMTPACRENILYMSRHAASELARHTWGEILSKVPAT